MRNSIWPQRFGARKRSAVLAAYRERRGDRDAQCDRIAGVGRWSLQSE